MSAQPTMTQFTATDHAMMARALRLAERGAYTTKPNPMVGCVIVRDGEIVGQGFHEKFGGPHAEVNALAEAGDRALWLHEAGGRGLHAHVLVAQPKHRASLLVGGVHP